MKQLAENEVSIKSLVDCFSSAFMKVLDVEDDSFWVAGDSLKTKVSLDEKRKYLRLSILFQLSGNITSDIAAHFEPVSENWAKYKETGNFVCLTKLPDLVNIFLNNVHTSNVGKLK